MIVTNKPYVIAQTAISGVAGILTSTDNNSLASLLYAAQDTQFWLLQDAGSGAYAIVNKANGFFLDGDAQGNVKANPQNHQSPDSQAWYFDLLDNGLCAIRNKTTRLTLYADPDSGDVRAAPANPSVIKQQWEMLDNGFISPIPVDLPCVFTPKLISEQVINIIGTQGLHLSAYDKQVGTQVWTIHAASKGCYVIQNSANGLVFESDTARNVFAKPRVASSDNQLWIFENPNNGYFFILNKGTGLYLNTATPDHISGQPRTGGDSQLWHMGYVKTDLAALGLLYPQGWNKTIDDHQPCAEYVSADSNYRTKQPTWTPNNDGGGTAVMQLDHIRGGATQGDDHATLTVTFLPNGQVYAASLDWNLGNKWAIEWGTKIVVKIEDEINDYASEEAGDAAAEIADVLSEGALTPLDPVISKVVSEMTSKLISSLFSQLNGMLKKELGHDDGGRQTFIAVINHNMNKLCASMCVAPALPLPKTNISFSVNDFPGALYSKLLAAYDKDIAESSVSWDGDQTTEYYVAGDTAEGNRKFSTWKQDCSAYPLNQGLYVSTKIDMLHGTLAKDGHYVVMAGFDSNGEFISAQAVLEFPPDSNVESYLSPVFIGTDANEQLYDDLVANKPNFAAPNAVKFNIDSMKQCVKVTSG